MNKFKFLRTFNRTDQEDPLKVFRYHIEIDGFARFGFSKVSGLKASTADVKYREGGDNTTEKKSPGLTSFPDVTFERGQILAAAYGAYDIVVWYTQVFDVSSKIAGSAGSFRRQIQVVQNNKEGVEVLRWAIIECWPKEPEFLPELDAMSSNNSIEKMVICHEGIRLLTPIV
jgi:phage tail-like protein